MFTTIEQFIAEANNCNLYDYGQFRQLCRRLDVQYDSGASRHCAIFPEEKYVLKIPALESCSRDYCELEVKNYQLAIQYGVEKVLLPLEFVCETDCGCKIYRQPMYSYALCNISDEDNKRLNNLLHGLNFKPIVSSINEHIYFSRLNRIWLARALQLYGKKFMRSFEQWTHTAQVNDLHSSNVGFLDGKPIILDYAGYYG